ncbi:MAG: hypothetical protein MAG795_00258 [Candidatus Woesearchaeota archaeon]|nr:hypothetical protein [Candidatus Woesearchaeota archaeon]
MKKLLNLFVVMLVALAVPVAAQEESTADPGTTPDSFLWGLERAIENIDLLLTFDVDEKIEKRLRYAEERLSEIEVMVDAGNVEAAQKAGKSHGEFLSDLKQEVRDVEDGDSEAELKKELEIERKVREHRHKVENLNKKLKVKIEVEGQITPEQQVLIDSVLAGLEGQTGEVEIEIENEKGKTKIKIEQELGKSGDDVEDGLEDELGLAEELREDAQEEIEDLEEELAELNEEGITVPERITSLFEQAKTAFDAGDYREAEKLAEQADESLEEVEKEAEREIELEIEEGRAKVEVEVGKNKYKFSLDTTDQEVIIDEIVARTGLSREEVVSIAEFEVEEEEDRDDASEAIDDAGEEISKAEEKIAEAEDKGKETSAAEDRLAQAQEKLTEAKAAFEVGNIDEAEELAEEARELASEARMKFLGKTAEELNDEEEIECVEDTDCGVGEFCEDGECEELEEDESEEEEESEDETESEEETESEDDDRYERYDDDRYERYDDDRYEQYDDDNRSTQEQTNDTTTKIDKTTFSIEEVNKHNSKDNCWIVIDSNVYDVTEFIASGEHNSQIINGCGIGATDMFEGIKKHASPKAKNLLDQFLIGTLE